MAAQQNVYYPTFDGEEPWEDFFAKFKFIARINGHTENRAWLMCACMRGAALKFACRLPEETQDDFEALVKHLERRFKKKIAVYQHMEELLKTKWRGVGDLATHADSIREHVEAILDGVQDTKAAVIERVTSQLFIASVVDEESRAAMARADPGTPALVLAETVGAIFEARAFAKSCDVIQQKASGNVAEAASAGNEVPTTAPHQRTEGVEAARPTQRRSTRAFECWRCGDNGHFTRDCPRKVRRLEAIKSVDDEISGNEE